MFLPWFQSRSIAVLALFLACYASALGQAIEKKAWTSLSPDPTVEPFLGQSVAIDVFGNTYTLQTQSTGMYYPWLVSTTDVYGNQTYNRQILGNGAEPAVAMVVDYFSSDVFVLASDSSSTTVYGFLPNGFNFNTGLGQVTALAIGFDRDNGEVEVAYDYDGSFYVTKLSEDGYISDLNVDDSNLNATSAVFDNTGNVYATGVDQSGHPTANFYNYQGTLQWTRSATNTVTDTFTFGAFAEDPEGNQYLVSNDANSMNGTTFTLVGINGGANSFVQTGSGAVNLMAVQDENHIYVAGTGASTPFLAFYNQSGLQWRSTQSVGAMACAPDQTGSVLTASYEASYKDVVALKIDANGALDYSYYFPATGPADLGNIVWNLDDNIWPAAVICGTTTSSSGSSVLVTRLVEGVALKAISIPTSAIGGQTVTGTATLTTAWTNKFQLPCSASGPLYVNTGEVSFAANSATGPISIVTEGVDATTTGTVTVHDYRGTLLTSNITINPADISTLALSASIATPDAPMTGTVKLNGEAGPSGATVTLSSDSASAVVPASFVVSPQASTGTFKITLKPVAATLVAHITAKRGTVTLTQPVTLTPPVLSLLSPATVTVTGGNKVNVTAWLSGQPYSAVSVSLTSSNATVLPVPTTITIPANTSNATTTLTSKAVTTSTNVTITAKYGSVTKTSVVTIKP